MIKLPNIYTTKWIKKFIIYFPVILVGCQVLINVYALIDRTGYNHAGFYLGTFLGTNIFFSVFLLFFTLSFRFCAVSRACAWAEVFFGLNYLIVQNDNLYNILFQVIIGVIALLYTYRYFILKFPLCRVSMVHKFLAAFVLTGSCHSAIKKWEKETTELLTQKLSHAGRNRNNS